VSRRDYRRRRSRISGSRKKNPITPPTIDATMAPGRGAEIELMTAHAATPPSALPMIIRRLTGPCCSTAGNFRLMSPSNKIASTVKARLLARPMPGAPSFRNWPMLKATKKAVLCSEAS